jgi:hypothetical protein
VSWSTPPTFTDGAVLTGAQMNILRDDLNVTPAALATAVGSYFVGTGSNGIGERQISTFRVSTPETTASAGYVELTTHLNITLTTSTLVMVMVAARLYTSTVDGICFAGVQVSGASTIAADDDNALVVTSSTVNARGRSSALTILTAAMGLVAGSNTFKQVYKVTAGTMTAASRELMIIPL